MTHLPRALWSRNAHSALTCAAVSTVPVFFDPVVFLPAAPLALLAAVRILVIRSSSAVTAASCRSRSALSLAASTGL